jgi:aminoglycoside 3-N-acetyltransferase
MDIALCDDDFERIGADFEASGAAVRIGRIGSAQSRLMQQRALVDFGVRWIEKHRG